MKRFIYVFFCLITIIPVYAQSMRKLPLEKIAIPEGFTISVYAEDVPGARSMVLGTEGTVFVGSREEGKVYAVASGKTIIIASGLNMPNGVAFRDGTLYVAEISRIIAFDSIEKNLNNHGKARVVYDGFPDEKHHGWKFIAFGPDGLLYVPIGAPCNVCESKDARFATIMRLDVADPKPEIYASGIRNSVGFDWDPFTKELWFTDNGRDMMGDDIPPDELNHAPEAGMNFGFPYCHGNGIADPEYGGKRQCVEFTAPALELGPHVAALGMRFYTGKMFPDEYKNRIFIAEHGSWNRSAPVGYRITTVLIKNGKPVDYKTFAGGWLQSGGAWGRPVDILVMPDGSLLVSDDKAGVIYRIHRRIE